MTTIPAAPARAPSLSTTAIRLAFRDLRGGLGGYWILPPVHRARRGDDQRRRLRGRRADGWAGPRGAHHPGRRRLGLDRVATARRSSARLSVGPRTPLRCHRHARHGASRGRVRPHRHQGGRRDLPGGRRRRAGAGPASEECPGAERRALWDRGGSGHRGASRAEARRCRGDRQCRVHLSGFAAQRTRPARQWHCLGAARPVEPRRPQGLGPCPARIADALHHAHRPRRSDNDRRRSLAALRRRCQGRVPHGRLGDQDPAERLAGVRPQPRPLHPVPDPGRSDRAGGRRRRGRQCGPGRHGAQAGQSRHPESARGSGPHHLHARAGTKSRWWRFSGR